MIAIAIRFTLTGLEEMLTTMCGKTLEKNKKVEGLYVRDSKQGSDTTAVVFNL